MALDLSGDYLVLDGLEPVTWFVRVGAGTPCW